MSHENISLRLSKFLINSHQVTLLLINSWISIFYRWDSFLFCLEYKLHHHYQKEILIHNKTLFFLDRNGNKCSHYSRDSKTGNLLFVICTLVYFFKIFFEWGTRKSFKKNLMWSLVFEHDQNFIRGISPWDFFCGDRTGCKWFDLDYSFGFLEGISFNFFKF